MKVLMPVLHYWPVIGGLETWTQNIAERLSSKAEIYVVTGKVNGQLQNVKLNQVEVFRTSLFSLKDLSYSSPFYIFTAFPFIFLKALRVVKKEKIDLCHCQGFLSSFLGFLLFKLTKVPYIATVQRLEQNKGFLRKKVYRKAKVCIAASFAIKDYFLEIGVKNIKVIPNGIELSRFSGFDRRECREKLGLKDEFVIMSVARLEEVKGIAYLIRAVHLLKEKHQVANIKYLIVGSGSEREGLENLVRELKLGEKVKFLGQIENQKLPSFLAAADVFVLSSLREGFGIAVLEAMAASLPVVASRVGGVLDIIEDQKNGILIEPKDSEGLAQSLAKIHSSPELVRGLIENSQASLKKYDWDDISQQVFSVYVKIA